LFYLTVPFNDKVEIPINETKTNKNLFRTNPIGCSYRNKTRTSETKRKIATNRFILTYRGSKTRILFHKTERKRACVSGVCKWTKQKREPNRRKKKQYAHTHASLEISRIFHTTSVSLYLLDCSFENVSCAGSRCERKSR
jgi:hypothetical protein